MNCDDVAMLAPLYLSRELDLARTGEFAAHLNGCASCSHAIGEQVALDELVRSRVVRQEVDTAAIEQHVRASISDGEPRTPARHRLMAALAIAALVLLAFVGYKVILASRTKAIYSAAARDHRREIVEGQPRKWQTDAGAIQQLAAGQGLSANAIAALAPAGYRLAQGRLCFLNGRVFVHLVFADKNGNFSLFLREQDTPRFAASGPHGYAAEHVAGFQKNTLTALVVTEESNESAMRLATSIASAL
jgi:anti-sigma factor RsiW